MKSKKISVLIIFSVLSLSCHISENQPTSYSYQQPPTLGDGWQTAHITSQNIDVNLIEEMVSAVKDNIYKNINSILMVRHNRLVLEEYFPGWSYDNKQRINYTRNTLHFIASCTKSFTSALVGIAHDRRLIPPLDTPIQELFPEFNDITWTNGKQNITIWHLLTMTAGMDWDEWTISYFDPLNINNQLNHSDDPLRFILEVPMAYPPGKVWAYNSGLSVLLGAIIKSSTGWYADEFAEQVLFAPLGIHEYEWLVMNKGVIHTGGGLLLKPRDMAKFGQLYLERGVWKGQRILSEYWVEESIKQHAERSTGWYGFQWWLEKHPWNNRLTDSFSAQGLGGQYIFVFTELDLVVVFTGGNQYTGAEPGLTLINLYVLPAVQ